MPAVLFVCTQNRFRSPLAAAMFEKCLAEGGIAKGWKVASAGTWTAAGEPAHPAAARLAHELGLNLGGHQSRPVSAVLLAWADLVLVMESGHLEALQVEFERSRGRVFLLSEVVDGTPYDLPDLIGPDGGEGLGLGREVCGMVKRGYRKICELAGKLHEASK